MKKIFLFLLCPVILFGGKLTEEEMEHLITTTMWGETGFNNPVYRGSLRKHLYEKRLYVVNPYWFKQPNFNSMELMEIDEETKAFIENLALRHKQLTGMDFELYFDEEISYEEYYRRIYKDEKGITGTMDIVFINNEGMKKAWGSSWPAGLAKFSGVGGSAYINVEKCETKERLFDVIIEETTQTYGFIGDTAEHNDSIFWVGGGGLTEIPEMDRKIINAMYQPEVKPGMNEAELRAVVAEVGYSDEAVFGGVFSEDSNETEEETEEKPKETPKEENPLAPGWMWWNYYPWVYRSADNSWYFFLPCGMDLWVWSQKTGEWRTLEEHFQFE